MPKIKGRNVLLKIAGNVTANATSCSLNIEKEMIEKASMSNGQWSEYVAGIGTWTMDCVGILDGAMSSVVGYLSSGTSVAFAFCIGDKVISGQGFIRNINDDAPVKGMATYKLQIQGSGPLTVN